jgi:hypothetical protein
VARVGTMRIQRPRQANIGNCGRHHSYDDKRRQGRGSSAKYYSDRHVLLKEILQMTDHTACRSNLEPYPLCAPLPPNLAGGDLRPVARFALFCLCETGAPTSTRCRRFVQEATSEFDDHRCEFIRIAYALRLWLRSGSDQVRSHDHIALQTLTGGADMGSCRRI